MTIGLIDPIGWRLLGGVGVVLVVATIATLILSRALRDARHRDLITNLRLRVGVGRPRHSVRTLCESSVSI